MEAADGSHRDDPRDDELTRLAGRLAALGADPDLLTLQLDERLRLSWSEIQGMTHLEIEQQLAVVALLTRQRALAELDRMHREAVEKARRGMR